MTGPAYEGWAKVEQMGFKQRIGKVTEVEFAGTKMLRIDVPIFEPPALIGCDEVIVWHTEFAGGASLYGITPLNEDVALAMARRQGDPRPVKPMAYRIERPRAVDVIEPAPQRPVCQEEEAEIEIVQPPPPSEIDDEFPF